MVYLHGAAPTYLGLTLADLILAVVAVVMLGGALIAWCWSRRV